MFQRWLISEKQNESKIMMNSSNSAQQGSRSDQKQLPNSGRKRTYNSWAIMSVLGLAVASLTGCAGKYTGSGSIPSVAGDANKATIAFNVQTDGDTDGDGVPENVKGQLQFQDLAAGVRVHGEVRSAGIMPETVWIDGIWFPAGTMVFEGPYTSQPPSSGNSHLPLGGKQGDFTVAVYSPQTPGTQGGGEQLYIFFWGGQEHGYYNFGNVSGGNITCHKAK